ncbi:MAG: guanylate kinase [Oscillospiraceae bacterium]|nr:guanylate kinase [Oscillospiraceae bacterium]
MSEKGKLIVISGPSGAGKSTVVFKAIENRNDVCFSTSVTTRKPRPGETDGKEYFFIDWDRYNEMVARDELLEHAEYVTNGYGTPRAFVEKQMDAGLNVLLDIEIQGARQVREKMPDAVLIFVAPPSLEELERRLRGRGTDTEQAIEGRLKRARQEYAEADFYDYLIINDDVEKAAHALNAIMDAAHCRFADKVEWLKNQ